MTEACKNCGSHLSGKYCSHCGQKVIHPGERKLSNLVMEYFHHFTHLDGKFLKTLRNIFFKPGKITRDNINGITAPHFKLSALFLIGTIIYFILPNSYVVSSSMNSDFSQQLQKSELHEWKEQFARRKSMRENISMEVLKKRYDNRQHDYGKLLTIILSRLLFPFYG